MGTSRRDFIKKGSLVALVAGLPLSLIERTAASEICCVFSGLRPEQGSIFSAVEFNFSNQ